MNTFIAAMIAFGVLIAIGITKCQSPIEVYGPGPSANLDNLNAQTVFKDLCEISTTCGNYPDKPETLFQNLCHKCMTDDHCIAVAQKYMKYSRGNIHGYNITREQESITITISREYAENSESAKLFRGKISDCPAN